MILAALIAGGFSLVALVVTKDREVSQFRRQWIDGLRDAVSGYIGNLQFIAHVGHNGEKQFDYKKYHEITSAAYIEAVRHLSRVELYLNPDHAKRANTPEFDLLKAVKSSKNLLGEDEFKEAIKNSDFVREKTAKILKDTWEEVKRGESQYRKVRSNLFAALKISVVWLIPLAIFCLGVLAGKAFS